MIIFVVLLLVSCLVLYKYVTRNYGHWDSLGIPSESPTFPLGNAWELFGGKVQVAKWLTKLYDRHRSPYFGIYILDRPYLVLRCPKVIKQVLIADFNSFTDRIMACDGRADALAGNSVFLLRGARWRGLRTKLTSVFTSSKLRLMAPIMESVGRVMEGHLDKFDGQIVDLKEVGAKFMTDVTALCFFGFETDSFAREDNVFRTTGRKMFDYTLLRNSFSFFSYFFLPSVVSLFKIKLLDPECTGFLKKIFRLAASERRRGNVRRRDDFVDLLMGLDGNFTLDEATMLSQCVTFYSAGFESTSNLVAFALYEICLNPRVQKKLRREMASKGVGFEELQSLKYLDMVIAETLRMYPFAPFLNRKCGQDCVVGETGFRIGKGTEILVPINALHYDPEYFPDPEKFDPERFEGDVRYTSDVFMPFGAGPRFCIGDRFAITAAKVSLGSFLRNFEIEKCDETPMPLVLNPRSPFVTCNEGLAVRIRKVK